MTDEPLAYCIDKHDVMTSVSRKWNSFAEANGWHSAISPSQVVGQPLWDFIAGIETRQLYTALFRAVRSGLPCGPIPFRCDSPKERRFLELHLSPLPHAQIEITSRLIKCEQRDPVAQLDTGECQSSELVTMCSMCKKIETAPDTWLETEAALRLLKPFESDAMPGVTHGVCPACYEASLNVLEHPQPGPGATAADSKARR